MPQSILYIKNYSQMPQSILYIQTICKCRNQFFRANYRNLTSILLIEFMLKTVNFVLGSLSYQPRQSITQPIRQSINLYLSQSLAFPLDMSFPQFLSFSVSVFPNLSVHLYQLRHIMALHELHNCTI